MGIAQGNKKHYIIPVFVPHKGCPFDCIYCNQKAISGQMEDMGEKEAKKTIESCISTLGKGKTAEIAFYGGSFTGIPKEQQIGLLSLANEYIRKGYADSIRISTRPDYINEDILDYLKEFNVKTIEVGVQSLDEEVLRKSCRGHSVDDVYSSSEIIKEYGFVLGIQTMIGLPGDTREKDIYTANEVIKIGPCIVRIYPTLVIRNTYLEKMYREGMYSPLSLEEAVDTCAELVKLYDEKGIKVIRTGLQPTENIKEGADVVAGPYHPAFGQLVDSRVILRTIENLIEEKGLRNSYRIVIHTDSRKISDVVGQKRMNLEYIKKKYGIARINVKGEENLDNIFIKKE